MSVPREIPDIPDSATEELANGNTSLGQRHGRLQKPARDSPQALHDRAMEKDKLSFAKRLVYFSGATMFLLGGVSFFWPERVADGPTEALFEFAKLLVMTVLGYVFGRGAIDKG